MFSEERCGKIENKKQGRKSSSSNNTLQAFTLIELLVVVGIIAILMVTVVITMNPGQLLAQSRDSNRLSDITSIDTSLRLASVDSISYGSVNTVYVSIPDNTATSTAGDQCQGIGLPSLPATYSYHCAASSTYRMTNGTGWLPVNMTQISQGTPLSQLPIDPINTSSSRNYYTYTTNGQQFEVTMYPESQKYRTGGTGDIISNDGGSLASVYERGTKMGLEPLDYGDTSLVGYWTFDEGTNSIAYDYSGNNATGSWSGTATGTSGYYSPGRVGSWAGAFDGGSTYVLLPNNIVPITTIVSQGISYSCWINTTNNGNQSVFGQRLSSGYSDWPSGGINVITFFPRMVAYDNLSSYTYAISSIPISSGSWNFIVGTYSPSTRQLYIYVNGVLEGTSTAIGAFRTGTNIYDRISEPTSNDSNTYFSGLVDDVRIYNRALSASEIQAMYNGNK